MKSNVNIILFFWVLAILQLLFSVATKSALLTSSFYNFGSKVIWWEFRKQVEDYALLQWYQPIVSAIIID